MGGWQATPRVLHPRVCCGKWAEQGNHKCNAPGKPIHAQLGSYWDYLRAMDVTDTCNLSYTRIHLCLNICASSKCPVEQERSKIM